MVEGASLKKGRSDRYQETWSKGRYDPVSLKNEKCLGCYFVHSIVLPSKSNKKTTPATGLIDSGNKTPSERKQYPMGLWWCHFWVESKGFLVFIGKKRRVQAPGPKSGVLPVDFVILNSISSNVLINSQQLNLLYSSSNWKRSIKSQANPVAR